MLTCYDATFAHVASTAGVDMLLIGDTLGMILQGHDSTLPVTVDDMVYHTDCVGKVIPGVLSSLTCHSCPVYPRTNIV